MSYERHSLALAPELEINPRDTEPPYGWVVFDELLVVFDGGNGARTVFRRLLVVSVDFLG